MMEYVTQFDRFRYTSALKDAFSSGGISGLRDLENRGMKLRSPFKHHHPDRFTRLGCWF
jgi:hypothetical protein